MIQKNKKKKISFLTKKTRKTSRCSHFRGWNQLIFAYKRLNTIFKIVANRVCVPCTFPFNVSMFLYSFLFPVTDLPGMPLLSPDAKLRFPICDMHEDRSGLLHFKRKLRGLWHPWRCSIGDRILRQKVTCQYGPLCVCVCMYVCVWQQFKSLHSSCLYWHENGNMRRVLHCGSSKKVSNIHLVWALKVVVTFPLVYQLKMQAYGHG